ncbi:MAG: TetR/AcrR family transcriptional regulator [Deltaproteobacteria bacterium]
MSKSREKIIAAASELFHKRGYHLTSLDEILLASQVTKSNFYYHFAGKEELALLVLDGRMRQFETEVIGENLLNPVFSPAQRLQKFYERVTAFHRGLRCEGGCPFGNMAVEMSDVSDKFRTRLSLFFESWQGAIKSCLEDGIHSGQFRSDLSSDLVAGLILTQIEGAILMAKTHKRIDPLQDGAQAMLKLLAAA